MKTKILAEDSQILVCLKPAGLAVQSARPGEADMVSELKNYLAASQRSKSSSGSGGRLPYLGLVHRLDQPVSGILVFGKTPKGAAEVCRGAAGAGTGKVSGVKKENGVEKGMEKEYRALVYVEEGISLPDAGRERELVDWLKKEPGQNLSRVVPTGTSGAKRAELSFRVAETGDGPESRHSCLAIRLYTGRHHQIRVQLAHAGLPLLGDARYGSVRNREYSARLGIRSICLCACRLSFFHPATGKRMEFETREYPWSGITFGTGETG